MTRAPVCRRVTDESWARAVTWRGRVSENWKASEYTAYGAVRWCRALQMLNYMLLTVVVNGHNCGRTNRVSSSRCVRRHAVCESYCCNERWMALISFISERSLLYHSHTMQAGEVVITSSSLSWHNVPEITTMHQCLNTSTVKVMCKMLPLSFVVIFGCERTKNSPWDWGPRISRSGGHVPPPPDVHQACRSRELLKSESKEESTACRKVPRQMRRLFKGGGEDRVRGVFLPFLPCISFPLPFFLFHPLSSPRSCPWNPATWFWGALLAPSAGEDIQPPDTFPGNKLIRLVILVTSTGVMFLLNDIWKCGYFLMYCMLPRSHSLSSTIHFISRRACFDTQTTRSYLRPCDCSSVTICKTAQISGEVCNRRKKKCSDSPPAQCLNLRIAAMLYRPGRCASSTRLLPWLRALCKIVRMG